MTRPSLWKTTRQLQEQSHILRKGLEKHPGESGKGIASKASKSLSHHAQPLTPRHQTKRRAVPPPVE